MKLDVAAKERSIIVTAAEREADAAREGVLALIDMRVVNNKKVKKKKR